MVSALLGRMDAAGQNGMVAKDLVDWYMTSDNYSVPNDKEGDADEMKSQLLTVIRRMVKRDKSMMAVKSTVKGYKRVEDMLLMLPGQSAVV